MTPTPAPGRRRLLRATPALLAMPALLATPALLAGCAAPLAARPMALVLMRARKKTWQS